MSGREPKPKRRRRALSHRAGKRRSAGDADVREVLERAFQRARDEEHDQDTHGFHAWPARMHRSIADELLTRFALPDEVVLDPFCGSGTVLVEARARGLASVGVDLNPLALRVSEVKARTPGRKGLARFEETLAGLVERSKVRVRARRPARAPLPAAEVRCYAPHVLKELAGLWEEIRAVEDFEDRRALQVLLSAIVVKVSRQRADTATRQDSDKRVGRFFPSELFGRKGLELIDRWRAYADRVPRGTPAPRLREGDARELGSLLDAPAHLVVTSPPYGGTYDYVTHHERRFPWLGLDARAFAKKEIGARRRLSRGRDARAAWDREVGGFLRSLADVLAPGGRSVLLLGDGHVGGERVAADEQVARLAPDVGLEVVATCAEERPDWTGGAAREEHLLALVRT
jgi:SAM-dependent methyltransferase